MIKESQRPKQPGHKDDIDRELSRAYFGGITERKIWNEPPRDPALNTKDKRKIGRRLKAKLWIILLAACAVTYITLFFIDHTVSVKVDLKVQRRARKFVGTAPKTDLDNRRPAIRPEHRLPLFSFSRQPKDERSIYDFEKDDQGWELPLWETDQPDHVAAYIKAVRGIASSGKGSIELYAEFPGGEWTAALTEISQYLDLTPYDEIAVDIYVPSFAPKGLRGKIILTVGENWEFVEMARGTRLIPGKWTTLKASIAKGSTDWRRVRIDDTFREDVRKISVRIESEKAVYSGPVYIDNVRVHVPSI
ncbi:MAG: hypothetical protein PHW14_02485 [Candidatus Omnitrophica bacterium]|nr:hypothetical protein [Candidatus Omnitrophota bacterium]